MRTEDILNLDCTKKQNRETVNKFLWKVKPVAKLLERNHYTKTEEAPIEILEQALHGIMITYHYVNQGIQTYYEGKAFIFYNSSILKVRETKEWIGYVYGKTLWEVVAKMIIKVYADIVRERKENE